MVWALDSGVECSYTDRAARTPSPALRRSAVPALHARQQTQAVERQVFRAFDSGRFAECWEQVIAVAKRIGCLTGWYRLGPTHHHRYAKSPVTALSGLAAFQIADEAFIGRSVVAREEDECVIRDSQFVEFVEDLADFGVHVLHHRAEAMLILADAVGSGVGPVWLGAVRKVHEERATTG